MLAAFTGAGVSQKLASLTRCGAAVSPSATILDLVQEAVSEYDNAWSLRTPLETVATEWEPDEAQVSLNLMLDGALVTAGGGQTSAENWDCSSLVVLDNFFGEDQRSSLYDLITGVFVRPQPYRAVLMDQDISHRLSTPSVLANRPRYSLVWKLVFFPKAPEDDCCVGGAEDDCCVMRSGPIGGLVGGAEDDWGNQETPPPGKWDRSTVDLDGLPGSWGLSDAALEALVNDRHPAILEVQSRISKVYPEMTIMRMPEVVLEGCAPMVANAAVDGDCFQW
eukprot:gene6733-8056_t